MITKDFLQYTGFCAPVISSLSCAVMLAIYRHRHGRRDENILYRLLITYFLAISLLWAISLVYVYFPLLYVRINILYFIGLLWGQVVFYQFIYTLTRLPGEKRFSPVHYIIPLVIVGGFAVWSAFVPFDVQVQLVVSRGEPVAGYEAYSRLFTSRLAFRGVWNIVYTALAWWRLLAYHAHHSGLLFQCRPFVFGVGGTVADDFVQPGSAIPAFCHLFQESADFLRFAAVAATVAGGAARYCLLQYGGR